jgi:Double-GTPase 2
MSDYAHPATSTWPGLEGLKLEQRLELRFERAVWGKVQGASSDYRWIAATAGFRPHAEGVVEALNLGSEDQPVRAVHWRTVGDLHLAVCTYPSRAVDAAGRSAILEKQLLAWQRPPDVPAALGALMLLPAVAASHDGLWWDRSNDARWAEEDFRLALDPSAAPPLLVTEDRLVATVTRGIAALLGAVEPGVLGQLYTALLSGRGGSFFPTLEGEPLPPEALAALLLPLPRAIADPLSIAGALPSARFDPGLLAERWQALAVSRSDRNGSQSLPTLPAADPSGQAAVRALEARDPAALTETRPAAASSSSLPGPLPLCLWGTSNAGKTVLIAQLYLDFPSTTTGWDIFAAQSALDFTDVMRKTIRVGNRFPPPTSRGGGQPAIEYQFRHRTTHTTATLTVEDRAGDDFRELTPEAREQLRTAAGLILLFDPRRDATQLEDDIWRTLDHLAAARSATSKRDPRPIAVCLSKSDLLLRTASDRRRALTAPDAFVRDQLPPSLIGLLDRYLERYRLFPISAIGTRLCWGSLEPVAFFDESLTPRLCPNGEPFNLSAPFLWLLEELSEAR